MYRSNPDEGRRLSDAEVAHLYRNDPHFYYLVHVVKDLGKLGMKPEAMQAAVEVACTPGALSRPVSMSPAVAAIAAAQAESTAHQAAVARWYLGIPQQAAIPEEHDAEPLEKP